MLLVIGSRIEQKQDFTHETTAVSSSQMPCEKKKNTHTHTPTHTQIDYFQYVRKWIYSFVDSHER